MFKAKTRPRVLRTDLLRCGDVILTRGRGKAPRKIAGFSLGRYSHAAFCLGSVFRLESDDNGIGVIASKLRECGYENDELILLEDVSELDAITVLRHPEFPTKIESVGSDPVFYQVIDESLGKEYPPLSALAQASPLGRLLPGLAKRLLASYELKDSGHVEKINPGPFCSQLIAEIFMRLNLRLFRFGNSRRTNSMSPNDLAHSRLRPVSNIFNEPGQNFVASEELLHKLNKDTAHNMATKEDLVDIHRKNIQARARLAKLELLADFERRFEAPKE
jgi:hypothetical protein